MRLPYCIVLVFLLGSSYVVAQQNAQQDQNSLVESVYGFIKVIEGLPVIGQLLTNLIKILSDLIVDLELITNGALGRVLGGALPCKLSIEQGLTCSGVDSANGGVGKMIMEILNNVPNILLPSFIKKLIGVTISAFIDPSFDAVFGGIKIA